MTEMRRRAWCDWAASMVIGMMPLLAHISLYLAGKPQPGWSDDWAPDILFITISNSGLAAISVFTRLSGNRLRLTPGQRVVWGCTLVCLALASMLYGATVTGMGNGAGTLYTAVFLMVSSSLCSLNFSLALSGARENAGG